MESLCRVHRVWASAPSFCTETHVVCGKRCRTRDQEPRQESRAGSEAGADVQADLRVDQDLLRRGDGWLAVLAGTFGQQIARRIDVALHQSQGDRAELVV